MTTNLNPQGPEVAEWTVMIYMVADDPAAGELLDQQANRELDQITFAALSTGDGEVSEKLRVAVQVDFRSQPDVWRRIIGEGAWVQPESAAADPATLYGFFGWVKEKCPADRYMLILWGHSRGPWACSRIGRLAARLPDHSQERTRRDTSPKHLRSRSFA